MLWGRSELKSIIDYSQLLFNIHRNTCVRHIIVLQDESLACGWNDESQLRLKVHFLQIRLPSSSRSSKGNI